MKTWHKRLGILASLALGFLPLLLSAGGERKESLKLFKGNVVPLAEWLEKRGAKLDADAAPYWYALVTDDGKILPLVKVPPAGMFFKDKQLLHRPMQITGRLIGPSEMLQAVNVHSLKDGKLHDVYYWCEICIIKNFEKGICECCGAPMEFREVPVK